MIPRHKGHLSKQQLAALRGKINPPTEGDLIRQERWVRSEAEHIARQRHETKTRYDHLNAIADYCDNDNPN